MAKATAKTVSKKAQAVKIYKSMQRRKTAPKPAEVKAKFVKQIGMTERMAATYYHHIMSGTWS